jgi:hypothetical protein
LACFKKLPKENNRPMGKNSPSLVTLTGTFFLVRGATQNGIFVGMSSVTRSDEISP